MSKTTSLILLLLVSIPLSICLCGCQRFAAASAVDCSIHDKNMRWKHARKHHLMLIPDRVESSTNLVKAGYEGDVKRTVGWVAGAGLFAGLVGVTKGGAAAIDFCSGYLLEQCLSVDNLFVILLIFEYFGVERNNQDRALQFGIYGAMVLRGIFIALGAVVLSQFHQILLVFAGILLYSTYKILFGVEDATKKDVIKNPLITFATKYFKTTDKMDGQKFFTVADGVWTATPYLLCTICIELADVLFAVDSVPAVFGITTDPFIVFTSNIFAIAGLRSLFGVLSQAMDDLVYLEKAVGLILGIIAVKMGVESVGYHLLSPVQSLLLVVGILGTGVALSHRHKAGIAPDNSTE